MRLIKYCYIILFLCINTFTYGLQNEVLKTILKAKTTVQQRIYKADSLLNELEKNDYPAIAQLYHDYAYWLYNKTDITRVIDLELKAYSIAKYKVNNKLLRKSAADLGFYYKKTKEFFKSIYYYKVAISLNPKHKNIFALYDALGSVYFEIKDYHKAFELFELAINTLDKSKNTKKLRKIYYNILRASVLIEDEKKLKKGIYYAKKTDSLNALLADNISDTYAFEIKRLIGTLYNRDVFLNDGNSKGIYNTAFYEALRYYNEALSLSLQKKDTAKIMRSYFGLGNLYNIYDKQKSIAYVNQVISYNTNNDAYINHQIYANLARTQNIAGDYNESAKNGHLALYYLIGSDLKDVACIDYSVFDAIDTQQEHILIVMLPQLGETYLKRYEDTKDSHFLDQAIGYFKLADYIIDLLKSDTTTYKSRLYWRQISANIYAKAIKACFLGNNTEDAFYFMEKNKALLLLEDIYNKTFKRNSALSPELSQKASVLKHKLALTNNLLIKELELSKQSIDSLKKQRIHLEIELSLLEETDKVETLNIESSIPSLQEVKNSLKANELIVEYYLSTDNGYGIASNTDNAYALFISNNKTELFEINGLSQLKEDIVALRNLFKSPFKTQEDISRFNALSNTIYKKVFPTTAIRDVIKGKQITIIPDGYLALVPFEALSVSAEATDYVIKHTEVHYAYSNSFLKHIKTHITNKNAKVKSLAIAPIHFKNNRFVSLTNSGTEINAVQEYYSGSQLIQEEASRSNFIKALSTVPNGIIHIASHADAQDNNAPWIAFNDQDITLEELYLTQNNAALVVLSGCNTSLGKQEIGEGLMSLARGFFYAGAQSVVSSLWSIDDRSTSEIVNSFYNNLSKGQTKSTALHNAKLTYLTTHRLSEASPHFWASLVLLGHNNTLPPSKSYWGLYLIVIVVIMFVVYRIKSKKLKTGSL